MDPKDLRFTENHEWCLVEKDVATLGVTEYGAKWLGDVVYVELPDPGDDVLTDEPWAEIESLESVMPLYSPADGRILEVNAQLSDDPTPIVKDPYGAGWIAKVRAAAAISVDELLTYDQYVTLTKKG